MLKWLHEKFVSGFAWARHRFAKPHVGVRFSPLTPKFYFWEWQPKYIFKDGKRIGPFLYSNKWMKIEEQSKLLFDDEQFWKDYLKNKAYNNFYDPPNNHIHLARHVISSLYIENKEQKEKIITLNKELSKLKRDNASRV